MPSFSVPPADRASRRVGTILAGKYGIEGVLGVGGMASVFVGVHRNGRRVAIKLLHEELGIHRDVRARFVREGYVANAVGHPGAVLVFDDDVAEDGAVFLVMELLEGETLLDRNARRGGRLPCGEVLALAHQLLDVLAAAHARGIVHRDIKPENLFLTTSLALKVLDFGVARMRDDTSAQATATGARIGTPAFMPPEQALGRNDEIDARTDLWAVGATMFSLLAGRTVHTAASAAELIVITATTPARSIGEFVPDLPKPVIDVVDRALRFARDDRFPDARAMQRALEQAYQAAFGSALDPGAVGPLPEPRVAIPRTEDERETVQLRRAQATTQPTPPSSAARPSAPTSEPTWNSDRPGQPPSQPRSGSSSSPSSAAPSSSAPASPRRPSSAIATRPDPTLIPSTSTLGVGRSVPPGADGARPSQPPPSPRRRLPLAAALTAAAAIGVALLAARIHPNAHSVSDPSVTGSAAPSASAGAPACSTNADCGGGAPAICRKDDHTCVPLETDQCKVLASPGDVQDDATVWIGAMFPYGQGTPYEWGPISANAIELARRDFAQASGGLFPVRPGGPRRPIGVVLCDDRREHERAATHLVKDVRVPAVLGFALSKEVMDLSTSLFLPNGVLALAANTSSVLRDIPPLPGGPRLVWRVTSSADMTTPVAAALLSDVVEPAVRAQPGVLSRDEPMRVALFRFLNPSGQTLADARVKMLRFNGKSMAENGNHLLEVEVPERDGRDDAELARRAAEKIRDFAPHVVFPPGIRDDTVSAIERAWPKDARFRPFYLVGSAAASDSLLTRLREHPDLRSRYVSFDVANVPEIVASHVLAYNAAFSPPIDAAHAALGPYDSFYVFAYAAAALGDEPITGPALARALQRLLPGPGAEPIDVGPAGIFRAQYALAAGKNIDLRGAQTNLDFDLQTGDAGMDFVVYCMSPATPGGLPQHVPSGLFFRSATRKLEGALRCP